MPEIRTVNVPLQSVSDHSLSVIALRLKWVCPVCGQPRGQVFESPVTLNKQRVITSLWGNPCAHLDRYDQVVAEAANNGHNSGLHRV